MTRALYRSVLVVCGLLAFLFILLCSCASAQGSLIAISNRRDIVFDHAGHYLYITAKDGWVRPYNLVTEQLETGYYLGGSLNALDIAPDDSYLLVAQNSKSDSLATIHRIDLRNGVITNITYPVTQYESGPWDLSVAANGHVLISAGESDGPLRDINLLDNTVMVRANLIYNTEISRSADYSRLYIVQGHITHE